MRGLGAFAGSNDDKKRPSYLADLLGFCRSLFDLGVDVPRHKGGGRDDASFFDGDGEVYLGGFDPVWVGSIEWSGASER